LHEEVSMAWRKVWKTRRKGVRKDAWLIRWYDDKGKMQAKTVHGTADEAEEECRRMEQELNDGTLGRRKKIHWLDFCQEFLEGYRQSQAASNRQGLQRFAGDAHCRVSA
jgi:hypothetical protein